MTENETMSLTRRSLWRGDGLPTHLSARPGFFAPVARAEREQIPANIKKIMQNKAPDLELRPDDILYVPNSLAKVVTARGVESAIGVGAGLLIWR